MNYTLKKNLRAFSPKRLLFMLIIIVSFACNVGFSFSQTEQIEINLNWSGDALTASLMGQEIEIPAVPFEWDRNGVPVHIYKRFEKNLHKLDVKMDIVSLETTSASSFDKLFLEEYGIAVPTELDFRFRTSSDRGKGFLGVELMPYIMEGGQLKRVKRVLFTATFSPRVEPALASKFVTNSAMASGTWYRLAIPSSGVYKIDQAFLTSNGINTSGLNPNHIHIFGNAMGMLPEANNIGRPDDLVNNRIFISGDQDGSFDSGDFIMFYANGPDEVRYAGSRLTQIKNIYATESYYYICIDASKTPERIASAQLTNQPATHVISSTDQIIAYEKDLVKYKLDNGSTVPSGKRWYGEVFDFVLEHQFNFNLSGLQTNEPVEFRTVYARSGNGNGSFFRVFLNNANTASQEASLGGGLTFTSLTTTHNLTSPNLSVLMRLDRINPAVRVFLDKIEINYRRNLQYSGGQYVLRDRQSVGAGNVASIALSGSVSSMNIWEITTPTSPAIVNYSSSGNQASFQFAADNQRQFIAFTNASALTPTFRGQVQNQNLHALPAADYLIVSHKDFILQANRLADLHRADGWTVHVVDVQQVYNEFSCGVQDPVAIRWFAKMFYDRANATPGLNPPLNLCLFGDGSYDPLQGRSENNNNMIVTYQTDNSESYTSSITSDGFFVLLDNNEAFNGSDGMDMGVGRIIATTPAHAKLLVDKIEHYKNHGSPHFSNNQGLACNTPSETNRGDWQLVITHIADDEDGGQFVADHESYVSYYSPTFPEYNYEKIYLDAYNQVTTSGGQRYPNAIPAVDSRVERGNLIMNYVGHGGETGLAYERIVTIPQIESWDNIDKLMLFVSATCEFTRFDDFSRVSAGELLYLSPTGGAVSMMTTTRAVFINVNSVVGMRFYENVFLRDAQERPITMGEIVQGTMNTSGSDVNRRAFMLLGDPMLRLNFPNIQYDVIIDSINGLDPALVQDTMKSLSKVRVVGHIADQNGNVVSGLNGVVVPTVFDKPKQNQTLGQDPNSPVMQFETQRNIVFKGKSTVTNGQFSFDFVVPKDIDYSFGNGKMSLFFYNQNTDCASADMRFVVGGVDPNGLSDNIGPDATMYLNSPSFVNGGITNETPVFIAKLFDDNGINAVGNGIGHDITLILDNNSSQPFVLNDYYEADLDTYQSGMVRFQLPKLSPGNHTLTFKVWDVNNNSSEFVLDFIVVEGAEVDLKNLLNYPNPFTTHTEFFFEHNQPGTDLEVQIQIFTISGKLVKTINQTMTNCGFRSQGIPWDGRDDFGDQLARGTYVYRVSVNNANGDKAEKFEKLVLLR
jgi:hypothetical protein